ncbi:MAG: hypothetical protein COB66_01140, partial [Coxiella sp. (in: Bacteria)]
MRRKSRLHTKEFGVIDVVQTDESISITIGDITRSYPGKNLIGHSSTNHIGDSSGFYIDDTLVLCQYSDNEKKAINDFIKIIPEDYQHQVRDEFDQKESFFSIITKDQDGPEGIQKEPLYSMTSVIHSAAYYGLIRDQLNNGRLSKNNIKQLLALSFAPSPEKTHSLADELFTKDSADVCDAFLTLINELYVSKKCLEFKGSSHEESSFSVDEIYNLFSMNPNDNVSEDRGNAFRHFENFRSLLSKPINIKDPKAQTASKVLDNVTSIKRLMLRGYSALNSIDIPASVMLIDSREFDDCNSLTSMSCTLQVWSQLPQLLKRQLKSITIIAGSVQTPEIESIVDTDYFSDCVSLESIQISAKVTSIGAYAFSSCSALTSINIPNSVTSIGSYAFYSKSLTSMSCTLQVWSQLPTSLKRQLKNITIIAGSAQTPEIEPIDDHHNFSGCVNLESIQISAKVTSNGAYAFRDCSKLISIIIPASVMSIGWGAFSGCSALTSIEIPKSVTSIGGYAFRDCSALTSIEIPNGVTSIGTCTFSSCSALTSINIPNSVTSIEMDAFNNCNSLTSMSCTLQVWSRLPIPLKRQLRHITIIAGSAQTPEGESIVIDDFNDHWNLKSIQILAKVTSFGVYAFRGCSALTSIKIPDGLMSIGGGAFSGCTALTSIEIPKSVMSIRAGAFNGCSALTSINIPNGVMSIKVNAFRDCTALTSIIIPAIVTSIEADAFNGCTALTAIDIPNGVTSIGNGAFQGC